MLEPWAAGLDGKALAEAVNSYSLAVMESFKENPDVAKQMFPALDDALTDIDFGKVRVAASELIGAWAELLKHASGIALTNPVIMANLLGTIPPLVNGLLAVLADALDQMALPPEILASALFNTISALDAESIGKILTMTAGQINDLHAGNLILGRDEPKSRAVFNDFMNRVMENLDVKATTDASIALAEDLEVIAGVLTELAIRDDEVLVQLTRGSVEMMNIFARTMSNMLSDFTMLDEGRLGKLGEVARHELAGEIGRMIDLYVTWDLKFRAANPGLNREVYVKGLAAVDTESAETLLREVGADWKAAALAHPGIRRACEPEQVARRINESLAAFNASAAGRPGAVGDYLGRLVSSIDSGQMEIAVRNVSDGLIEAAFASTGMVQAMTRIFARNLWKTIKAFVAFVGRKITGGA
ncbi:MAG: hypothetical protein V1748_02855 [Actinomycetota bacterium]